MKHLSLLIGLFLLLSVGSCSDSIEAPAPTPGVSTGNATDAYHDNIRQSPYPKADNELFLNPPPFIVPEQMKPSDGQLQFALSRDAAFPEAGTLLSEPERWCMYNPHRTLENGTWYWRFRPVSADGIPGEWSATYCFEMTDDVPRFLTPDVGLFIRNLPSGHPRLHAFLNDQAESVRQSVASHPEYKSLVRRANTVVKSDFSDIAAFYQNKDGADQLNSSVLQLYQAYYLTRQPAYADKLLEIVRAMLQRVPTDKELFSAPSNFVPTQIAQTYIQIYDLLFDRLPVADRMSIEEILLKIASFYYRVHMGKQENALFDSHFWQHNLMVLFQCAYMLYDKAPYREEVLPMLRYYYEVWTARAPGSGFNRDGVWHNSASYLNTNTETLYYMPSIFSHITGSDFLKHPWYQAAGKALVNTWPAGSQSCGFGDGSSEGLAPSRIRIALADFLARRTGDSYAAWYAGQCAQDLHTDILLRLDRMVDCTSYATDIPKDLEKMVWYRDAGEVVMHSDLTDTDRNLSVAFRSSRYGCNAHTFANQNAFNILYKGRDVFRNTGYYLKYGSPHHITSCRHTRAHNTILVNGIGQGFTSKAYGNVVRGLIGNHITYCLGDASNAYKDTSEVKGWLTHFKDAGIEQTPEYGFGTTPLTRYLRHVWMLHPDVVVVYDELEASEPVRWDWLLHSPVAFHIEAEGWPAMTDGALLTVSNAEKRFAAQACLFSTRPYSLSQTDRFVTPPSPEYPNQWHLNATVTDSRANRFLFIVQVCDRDKHPLPVGRSGNVFTVGDWRIEAEMDATRTAAVRIMNESEDVLFDYSTADQLPLPDGKVYRRKQTASSVLYDTGMMQEQSDYLPKHTRAVED